jgi:hypothetical protein
MVDKKAPRISQSLMGNRERIDKNLKKPGDENNTGEDLKKLFPIKLYLDILR